MKAKIYTKTGDKGQTSLVGGARVSKTDRRLEAYGTLDELNSVLGILRSHVREAETESALQVVQNNLFNIGSHLACEDDSLRAKLPNLSAGGIAALEQDMDRWEKELPTLRNFILPGGSVPAAFAHLGRTVCRRAERLAIAVGESHTVLADHVIYLNRLSDWLFLLARSLNRAAQVQDVEWTKG